VNISSLILSPKPSPVKILSVNIYQYLLVGIGNSPLIAQAAELLQQISPLIAIFIGGYNLLSNLSRGMAAIKIK
jgi:hypothetical protein